MSARPTLFVSHAAEDQEIVKSLGDLLAALSLQQLQIWFSSDKRADGGLQPGDIWFQQIQERLKSCAAILVVITDKSVDRPWIYFESGYGSASPEKKLFVVTCGISSLSQISPPLSFWQMYRVDTKEGLSSFSSKLLELYGIPFSQLLFNGHSKEYLKLIGDRKHEKPHANSEEPVVETLLAHIDRRVFELASALSPRDQYMSYNVTIESRFDGREYQLEIFRGMRLQEALDRIWQMISDSVPPYTYLLKWILKHKKTGIPLIVKEVQFAITAADIFKPKATWVVGAIEKPFRLRDGGPRSISADESLD